MMQALAALETGDSTPFRALFADDLVWRVAGTTPWSGEYRGRAEVGRLLGSLAAQIEGPYRLRATRVIAEGPLVVVEARGDNTLRAGGRYDNTYCFVCRFEGGLLRELDEHADTDLVRRVLAAPERGAGPASTD
jgi:ketosteroid isomerase-like protein